MTVPRSLPANALSAPQIPVKKLINGIPYEKLNLSSAEDPQCLRYFVDHPELKLPGKAKL